MKHSIREQIEDVVGVILLFGGIILFPYAIALVKALF